MSIRTFIVLMTIATIVFWVAWFTVLLYIDPFTTNFIGFLSFYVSFFFGLMGVFTLIGFGIRYLMKKDLPAFRFIGVSLRQAIWFSGLVVASLILQGQQLFTWWAGLLMVFCLAILEAFFLSRAMEKQVRLEEKVE
ncbi:MAG: hypothetical protein ABH835_00830 [Patescibacteria group bacterium]|nr:hypothetical protein [Patescibacteria group bacterium]